MCNELRHLAMLVAKLPAVEVSRDPADNFLLAMAQLGEADFLVTGDKRDLLSLRAFRRTKIVTASRIIARAFRSLRSGANFPANPHMVSRERPHARLAWRIAERGVPVLRLLSPPIRSLANDSFTGAKHYGSTARRLELMLRTSILVPTLDPETGTRHRWLNSLAVVPPVRRCRQRYRPAYQIAWSKSSHQPPRPLPIEPSESTTSMRSTYFAFL